VTGTSDIEWTAEEWKEELPFRKGPKPKVKHQRGHRSPFHEMCGGVFRCIKCGKYYGWCYGATDGTEADEWCDDCWYKKNKSKEN